MEENLLQAVLQGILAGPGALYLYIRSVALLGAARASVFPALVPPFVLLIGWIVLGERRPHSSSSALSSCWSASAGAEKLIGPRV